MFRDLKTLGVELSTPGGRIFSGEADSVELLTTQGVISINPQEVSYLHLTHTTEITVRVGAEFLSFVLQNAAASLRNGLLTVLAAEIQILPAPPVIPTAQSDDS